MEQDDGLLDSAVCDVWELSCEMIMMILRFLRLDFLFFLFFVRWVCELVRLRSVVFLYLLLLPPRYLSSTFLCVLSFFLSQLLKYTRWVSLSLFPSFVLLWLLVYVNIYIYCFAPINGYFSLLFLLEQMFWGFLRRAWCGGVLFFLFFFLESDLD